LPVRCLHLGSHQTASEQQFPDGRFFWLGPVSFAPGGADACRRAWLSRDLDRPGGSDRRSEAGALVS
jgi:hypothetical protein